MGCINTKLKLNSDEVVNRCRARKRFMKQAVMYRHAFAAAHSAYLQAMRNTGAALREFAEGEAREVNMSGDGNAQFVALPEPPPPPPLRTPSPARLEHRSTSFPFRLLPDGASPTDSRPMSPLVSSSQRKDENWALVSSKTNDAPAPPSPPPSVAWDYFDPFRPSTPPFHLQQQRKIRQTQEQEENRRMKQAYEEDSVPDLEDDHVLQNTRRLDQVEADEKSLSPKWERKNRELALVVRMGGAKDLLEIVKELDDQFLKASSGGTEVSRLLETRKAHFHTNFPQTKRRNHHSARVFSALSWNWSRSSLASKDEVETPAEEAESVGSHALTLERLYAWEKKLFDEVKAGETLRSNHQRKCSLLRYQEARGEDTNTIDKTRALIKRLHSLILVSFQGVDSTSSAIQSLRDDELYPQLVEFVEALTSMWRTMHECHLQQKQIVVQIKNLDSLVTQEATSDFHHHATIQLERELSNWYECFCKLVSSHRGYMTALNGWLRLTLIQIETEEKEEVDSSPKKVVIPKIFYLCEEWQRALDRLPDKVASEAIKSLAVVVHALVQQQTLELKQRRKAESLAKKLEKKMSSLHNIEKKYSESSPRSSSAPRRPPPCRSNEDDEYYNEEEGTDVEIVATTPVVKETVAEKRAATDAFRKKVEGEKEKHLKSVQDTRILTMNNLQTGLPGVFEAMTGFSGISAQAFEGLWSQINNKQIMYSLED